MLAGHQIADVLTGGHGGVARETATEALPWMLLAATFQLFAGLAASALAALDDYVTPAAGFVLGSVAGLALILLRVDADGVVALSHGMALNGAVALAVPVVGLALRARSAAMPGSAVRPGGEPYGARLATMGSGIALPLALQAIYLICLPFAAHEGDGALTTFGFAYLISSAVVAVTASSLGLVTAVPLARAGIDAARTTRHVVASAWIALVVIGAAAGVFALAGGQIAQALLGSSYSSERRRRARPARRRALALGRRLGRRLRDVPARLRRGPWPRAPADRCRRRRTPARSRLGRTAAVRARRPRARARRHDGSACSPRCSPACTRSARPREVWRSPRSRSPRVRLSPTCRLRSCFRPSPPPPSVSVAYAALLAVVRPAGFRAAWRYLRALA